MPASNQATPARKPDADAYSDNPSFPQVDAERWPPDSLPPDPLANAFGFSTVLPSEHTAIAPTPTSTPMVGPCHFSPTLTR